MKTLFAAVTEAREAGTSRRLCDLFMVKPSKKDYPDYYKVILEPMDLKTIEHNIRNERYTTEEALMEDMKLMFRNARIYNEEGSQVDKSLTRKCPKLISAVAENKTILEWVIYCLFFYSFSVVSCRYIMMLIFWKKY